MDRDITVRFYEIEHAGQGPTFADALRVAAALPLAQRERVVGEGITLRIEHFSEVDGIISADFTRVQTDNLPSHPTDVSTDPLPIHRLGHHAALCYDTVSRIAALQFDMKMAAGRLCRYGNCFSNGSMFSHLPVLEEDALNRFEHETPTKFRVKIAGVNRFAAEAGAGINDFELGIERLGAYFGAPTVEVTVSARMSQGGLERETVWGVLQRLLGVADRHRSVKTIIAETDESPDPFNFLQHLLKRTTRLELPTNDLASGRDMRIDFAKRCFNEQRDYLRARYARHVD